MRLFEATGAGACLVTDAKSDHAEVFTPDSEVVTYASTAECIEKVRWLIEHPAAAREIARRGQERTFRDHTFAQRAVQLEGLLLEHLRDRGRQSV
jgi:spore maturation protein CgeB